MASPGLRPPLPGTQQAVGVDQRPVAVAPAQEGIPLPQDEISGGTPAVSQSAVG